MNNLPDGWREGKLGNLGQAIIGLTYKPENVVDSESGLLVLRSSNVQNGEIVFEDNVYVDIDVPVKLIVKDGDILICVRNGSRDLIGKCALIDKNSAGNTFGAFMAVFRAQKPEFVFQLLQTVQYKREIHRNLGATINQITNSSLNSFSFLIPPEEEQDQIVEFLSTWDKAVSQLREQIAIKQKQKKALIQLLLTGKHRFPEFEGKWRNVLLGDVTIESTKRNNNSTLDDVRAVNKTHGMIPMKEETIGNSLERYKVVEDKDFAYNPMRINIGSICRWEEKSECLVSPDYVVFRVKEGALDSDYLSHFRNSHRWAVFMEQAGAGGVRIRIYYKDLASMIIPLPPTIAEQKKIAAVLNAADKEIDLLNQKLEAYQEQKKGLMQQLLTGKKRVKITRKEAA